VRERFDTRQFWVGFCNTHTHTQWEIIPCINSTLLCCQTPLIFSVAL